jgi:hypothetical protein
MLVLGKPVCKTTPHLICPFHEDTNAEYVSLCDCKVMPVFPDDELGKRGLSLGQSMTSAVRAEV